MSNRATDGKIIGGLRGFSNDSCRGWNREKFIMFIIRMILFKDRRSRLREYCLIQK